jgi:hypothetical protein
LFGICFPSVVDVLVTVFFSSPLKGETYERSVM